MSRNYKQYIGALALAKKLIVRNSIAVQAMSGLGNALSSIQGAIIAGVLLDKKVYVLWDDHWLHLANTQWDDLFEPPQAFELLAGTFVAIDRAYELPLDPIDIKYRTLLLIIFIKLSSLLLIFFPDLRKYVSRKFVSLLSINKNLIDRQLWWHLYGFDAWMRYPNRQNSGKALIMDLSAYKNKQRIYLRSWYNIFDHHYDKPLPPHLGHYDFFKPIASLQKRIDAVTGSFNDNTIGVHIRRTDLYWSTKYSPTTVFIKVMYQAIASKPDTLFYIASDDANEIKAMQAIFGTRIITQQNTNFDRYTKKGIHSAVIDLFCLSKTQRIIGSAGSSFGRTAAKIGHIDFKEHIIDQQQSINIKA